MFKVSILEILKFFFYVYENCAYMNVCAPYAHMCDYFGSKLDGWLGTNKQPFLQQALDSITRFPMSDMVYML